MMDINADAGEGFGRWALGNDRELFTQVTTANIACGYHAGDPATMRRTVAEAVAAGVNVGAHPGYPDLLGFGRRAMSVSVAECIDYVLYQVGALSAIAAIEGAALSHVKPHGALYFAIGASAELAVGVTAALQQLRSGLPLLICPGIGADAVEAAGLPLVRENAVDLEFDEEGRNIIERVPAPKDPATIAAQAVRMARGRVLTAEGTEIPMSVGSMCVHGDRPNAPAIAAAVRTALEGAGFTVASVFGRSVA